MLLVINFALGMNRIELSLKAWNIIKSCQTSYQVFCIWVQKIIISYVVMISELSWICLICVQVEFTAMREQYMRCGEGFVLCYSVTDRRSFRAAAEYRRLLAQARPAERLPLVLVGNKLDLAPRFRQVTLTTVKISYYINATFNHTMLKHT